MNISEFDYKAFHRKRKFLKGLGLFLVILGLFTLVDMMSEVPIPLVGYRAIFAGTLMIIFGLMSLYRGYKLPLDEALELIHNQPTGVTESELVHTMLVDQVTARRIINALLQKGFLRGSSTRENVSEEVYEAVR